MQNFNVAHYSKSIIGINTKLGILADHDKMQLQDKGLLFWSFVPISHKLIRQTSIGSACGGFVNVYYEMMNRKVIILF